MARNTQTPVSLGQLIKRERLARNMSQKALADLVETNQQTIGKIEAGDTKHSSFIPKILPKLGIPLSVLVNDVSDTLHSGGPRTTIREHAAQAELPIYGAVEGGRGALIVSADPVEYLARPAPLDNVRDGYGVLIVEESMFPEFESGDIALIHPHLAPKPGDTCVFYSTAEDGTKLACIKRLRRTSPTAWHVTQWNPQANEARDFELSRAEWQDAHVTVGRHRRR